mmetsp:Transcript_960/g.1366  ORF Transcript_960/g.1366 Transcript_960/m.1366 type:complete len:187 (-) Transcript_960:1065-1625(-)|eukprot:CAMPEP_0204845968 /NCGR_PEP_ID=MMETSP1347-20130617/1613_1 /ASSEMBLY_ACC=CAM_ASM_000690 /TAXON_ID=215587 /ORGANISM="Aplanochytrium stocchinoi, Strain GSBS06" /LENGTH=186 /DNA_ID=CAMNT_0051986309 /DNA_START=462 /DNA_END=1022 /DNA_ORIENTATION=-
MSASANAGNDASVPCSTPNCGFWGTPSTGNFCSRCYKEKMNENQQKPTAIEKSEEIERLEEKVNVEEVKSVEKSQEKESSQPPVVDEKAESKKCEDSESEKILETELKVDTTKKRKVQKNRMRCFECRKKVGLTGIECSCGYVFCGVHRYPEDHSCDFDFKKDARERFEARKNKSAVVDKIVGEKL